MVAALIGMALVPAAAQAETWTNTFSEDFESSSVALGGFNSSPYAEKFTNYDGWTDTSGHGTYSTEQTTSVHDGVLDIWLHSTRQNGTWKHWVQALLPQWPCGDEMCSGMRYGYVSVSFVADNASALSRYKTAWLLWPDSNDWAEGEIDLQESCTDLDGGDVCVYTHGSCATTPCPQDGGSTNVGYRDGPATCTNQPGVTDCGQTVHRAEMWWKPGEVSYALDGVLVAHTEDDPRAGFFVPDASMHFVLQNETQIGVAPPSNSAEGHVYVDSIEEWDLDPSRGRAGLRVSAASSPTPYPAQRLQSARFLAALKR